MSLINSVPEMVVTTKIDEVLNWSRKSSVWYMLFGLACCAIEMMQTGGPRADLDLSLIHISEPTRLGMISYAVFCLTSRQELSLIHI